MKKIVFNNSRIIRYYETARERFLDENDLVGRQIKPTSEDLKRHISNGIFTLRRPGTYNSIAGICAIPPRTSWHITDQTYSYIGEIRSPICRKTKEISEIFEHGQRIQQSVLKDTSIGVELSGGLDSSILVDFFLRANKKISLLGFVSDRYEFRTERAIQDYYLKRTSNNHIFKYEDYPAFASLDEIPPHPYPAQESLFFSRHRAMASIASRMGVRTLLSGEAGDQLLGFCPEECDLIGHAPAGYGYWNLSEMWSHQYVYLPRGVEYISGLAVGLIPAAIMKARVGQKEDVKKMWARRSLSNYLPKMLTEYAYKAFHDGWVVEGLVQAANTIKHISRAAYFFTRHDTLSPDALKNEALNYRNLSENAKARFLAKLSFVTWVNSNLNGMVS